MSIKKINESTRGTYDYGWLKAKFSFSFASWYNSQKMGFGVLRVLNNDRIAGSTGFPTHFHKDMEIVTIPLKGAVAHKDSTGGEGVIETGEVQIMSAGTGISHSEFNASQTEELELFQIWIIPEKNGLAARYDQARFDESDRKNKWQTVISPTPEKHQQAVTPLKIYQETYFNIAHLEEGQTLEYKLNSLNNGVYLMVVEGEVEIDEVVYNKRDAAEITQLTSFKIQAKSDSVLLAIEVLM